MMKPMKASRNVSSFSFIVVRVVYLGLLRVRICKDLICSINFAMIGRIGRQSHAMKSAGGFIVGACKIVV